MITNAIVATTNMLAKIVIIISTNWTSYEGFKLEYESNMTYCNAVLTPSVQGSGIAGGTFNVPWSPKVILDEKLECPFVNQVVASTNNYARVGEVIRVEKYVLEGGWECEKSKTVIGYVKQAGRKMMKTEWQWDEPTNTTATVTTITNIISNGTIVGSCYSITNDIQYHQDCGVIDLSK